MNLNEVCLLRIPVGTAGLWLLQPEEENRVGHSECVRMVLNLHICFGSSATSVSRQLRQQVESVSGNLRA